MPCMLDSRVMCSCTRSSGCITGAHLDDRRLRSVGLAKAPQIKGPDKQQTFWDREVSRNKVSSHQNLLCPCEWLRCLPTKLVSVYLLSEYCTWVPSVHTYMTRRSHSPFARSHKLPTFPPWESQLSHFASPNLLQSPASPFSCPVS